MKILPLHSSHSYGLLQPVSKPALPEQGPSFARLQYFPPTTFETGRKQIKQDSYTKRFEQTARAVIDDQKDEERFVFADYWLHPVLRSGPKKAKQVWQGIGLNHEVLLETGQIEGKSQPKVEKKAHHNLVLHHETVFSPAFLRQTTDQNPIYQPVYWKQQLSQWTATEAEAVKAFQAEPELLDMVAATTGDEVPEIHFEDKTFVNREGGVSHRQSIFVDGVGWEIEPTREELMGAEE